MKSSMIAVVLMSVMAAASTSAQGEVVDAKKSAAIAYMIKSGVAVIESLLSEHARILPQKENCAGKDHWVFHVPMIREKDDDDTRCSLNWSKDWFNGSRGRVRIELVNVPDRAARGEVYVQGKGDKGNGRIDRNREVELHLSDPIELDWGPGHETDRAFYFAHRRTFEARRFLDRYPAAAFRITILAPLP